MEWIEVSIETVHEGIDIMAQIFYELGVQGVVIQDPADISGFEDSGLGEIVDDSLLNNMNGEVTIKGYLPNDASFHDKYQYIKEKIGWLLSQNFGFNLGTGRISMTSVNEEDWANSWKKYFKPVAVGQRIVVKPTWEEYQPKEEEIILELDPGMAFGTGTHQTTILCIRALEKLVGPHHRVLDIGCGTGILSIASLLLGAQHAVAVDIDPDAVKITRENAMQNGVLSRMDVVHGNLLDKVEGKFDIIVANIIADTIIELSGLLKDYLNKNGYFIASGIIVDRLNDVLKALDKEQYGDTEYHTLDEWAVVVVRNA
ncbi:MAG: 50S ribosomal protein L11 methyltransferase [Clostridiales bacterium]|jgi:ribosomal protein L11 methyltransferase|nr:50S ribosomal protein L11 methyltransferase [Clostridiales bacterium]